MNEKLAIRPLEQGRVPVSEGKLAFFIPNLTGGGAEKVMVSVATGMGEKGWDVDLVAAEAVGPLRKLLTAQVNVVDLQSSRLRGALPKLVSYLRERRPDALITTLSHANILAVVARRLARVNTAVVVRQANRASRDSWAGDTRLLARVASWVQRRTYMDADRVVAVSRGVAGDLNVTLGIPRDRIETIYNPLDIDKITALSESAPPHPWLEHNENPVIVAVGRLTPLKDFPTLIEAFERLRRERHAKLIIVGEGPERPRLEQLITTYGLQDDVALPGFTTNPYAYMARASVFVLSSINEGMPNALIEALALGLPVVATDCESGPREILADGEYGVLVPVGDAARLANAIGAALVQPKRPRHYTRTITAPFAHETCLQQYESLLRAVRPG